MQNQLKIQLKEFKDKFLEKIFFWIKDSNLMNDFLLTNKIISKDHNNSYKSYLFSYDSCN